MYRILLPVILGALLVSGCTKVIGVTKYAIKTDAGFNQLFLEDVQSANALARATNDKLAIQCWTYLEKFTLDNTPDLGEYIADTSGVLAVYQKARNVRRTVVEVKISDEFRIACAPMLMESTGALGRLGIRIGRLALPF